MKIYTKTGDKGMTRLVDGSCVEKFNPRVEAYGCVDELNSQIGLLRSQIEVEVAEIDKSTKKASLATSDLKNLDQALQTIQSELFNVGSLLATEKKEILIKMPQITEAEIIKLEKWIDSYSENLPELRNFILPGGHILASHLHLCRTFCRRSERRSSEIYLNDESTSADYQNLLIYLNRLSDLFFILARWINFKAGTEETIWKKSNE